MPQNTEKERKKESEVSQSCPTLCDPVDCSLPGSSVHAIFQAIVLEWIAISFSRESSQLRDRTQLSHIVDRRFTVCANYSIQRKLKIKIKKLSRKAKREQWRLCSFHYCLIPIVLLILGMRLNLREVKKFKWLR